MATRIDSDSMGELEVPSDALYSAQTQRAINNFPISGKVMPEPRFQCIPAIAWHSEVLRSLRRRQYPAQARLYRLDVRKPLLTTNEFTSTL
mgnify:CR=1 FL=1